MSLYYILSKWNIIMNFKYLWNPDFNIFQVYVLEQDLYLSNFSFLKGKMGHTSNQCL